MSFYPSADGLFQNLTNDADPEKSGQHDNSYSILQKPH